MDFSWWPAIAAFVAALISTEAEEERILFGKGERYRMLTVIVLVVCASAGIQW